MLLQHFCNLVVINIPLLHSATTFSDLFSIQICPISQLVEEKIPLYRIAGSSCVTGPAQKELFSVAVFVLSSNSKHMEEHDLPL